jgi:hypothetical protein
LEAGAYELVDNLEPEHVGMISCEDDGISNPKYQKSEAKSHDKNGVLH